MHSSHRKTTLSAAIAACLTTGANTSPDVTAPKTDAELDQAVEAAKPTAPRITKEHIQALIVDESYTNIEGTRTTVCRLGLANGFCVVGVNNGPVSAANFDQQIGCEYAYKAAVDQIWPLEGYLLAERLWRGDVEAEKLAKLRYQGVTGDIAFDKFGDLSNAALTIYTYRGPRKVKLDVVR